MDRFDAITAFIAVVEQNGFAPAARRLGQAPPTTTRLVASLEQHLGVRLLNRSTRRISLTDAGSRFLDRAQRIVADLAEAERMAENERGAPTGRLVVAAPLVFGRLHVAPLLCTFMNAHPEVQGELLLGDRVVNLVEEGIDVAVRIGTLADAADIARRIGSTRRVLVGSPTYLKRAGTPRHPTDLTSHRLIAFTNISQPRLWRFRDGEQDVDVDVAPTYATNSADAAIWHAAHDGGLALALSYQVQDLVRAGALRPVLEAFEPLPRPIQFVYASSRLLSVKVRALIDLAVETCDWSFETW